MTAWRMVCAIWYARMARPTAYSLQLTVDGCDILVCRICPNRESSCKPHPPVLVRIFKFHFLINIMTPSSVFIKLAILDSWFSLRMKWTRSETSSPTDAIRRTRPSMIASVHDLGKRASLGSWEYSSYQLIIECQQRIQSAPERSAKRQKYTERQQKDGS